MFSVDENRILITELPIITGNYHEILFHEVPVLFTGTNYLGNYIIGSSVDEDYHSGFERYFHIIVSTAEFSNYINGLVTYRLLLEKAKPIYVMDKYVSQDIYRIYQYTIEEIPEEYLPVDDTYCPQWALPVSFTYSSRLTGERADQNTAYPNEVNEAQTNIASLLEVGIESLQPYYQLQSEVTLLPASYGSYSINYLVSIDEKNRTLFSIDSKEYLTYLNKFISYCVNHLHKDAVGLTKKTGFSSEAFNSLLDFYCQFSSIPDDRRGTAKERLVESLYEASRKLKDAIKSLGKHYNQIAMANVSPAGENILGVISAIDKPKIEEAISTVEKVYKDKVVDTEPLTYNVHIYQLNVDTRQGRAYMPPLDRSGIQSKPTISISGDDPLEGTKYTESLHLNKLIEVRGRATRFGNKIQSLDIVFELR